MGVETGPFVTERASARDERLDTYFNAAEAQGVPHSRIHRSVGRMATSGDEQSQVPSKDAPEGNKSPEPDA